MHRLLAVVGLTFLSACAPPGYVYDQGSFVPHAKDACARPEIAIRIADLLNVMIGKPDGPPDRVLSIQNMVSPGPFVDEGNDQSLSCHATLVLSNGQSEAGNVFVFKLANSSGALQVSWKSDINLAKQQNAEAIVRKANDWRSFHGNIATWSGIPPLPASASASKSARAPVHCTVADAVDHVVTVWLSKTDCQKWIDDAQVLAGAGPTPIQVQGFRRSKCIDKLSSVSTQSRSGEFYEICSRIGQ